MMVEEPADLEAGIAPSDAAVVGAAGGFRAAGKGFGGSPVAGGATGGKALYTELDVRTAASTEPIAARQLSPGSIGSRSRPGWSLSEHGSPAKSDAASPNAARPLSPALSGRMSVVASIPAVARCLVLAQEVVACGPQPQGKQARSGRLRRRTAVMMPLLHKVQQAVDRQQLAEKDAVKLANEVREVLQDVRRLLQRAETPSLPSADSDTLALLRATLACQDRDLEFCDLLERLSAVALQLGAALGVRRQLEDLYGSQQVQQEVEVDAVKDLQALAVRVAADPKVVYSLAADERGALEGVFRERGLELQNVVAQLRLQGKQQFVDAHKGEYLLRWQDITVVERLGSGSFGEVHSARFREAPAAVKLLPVPQRSKAVDGALRKEAYIMSQLKHPSLATFYGLVQQQEACALVTAYYPRGSLAARLQDGQPLEWPTRIGYALDVAKGMAYLHARPYEPIVHGDLKAADILLDDTDHVVVSDCALRRVEAAAVGSTPADLRAPPLHPAPELIADYGRPRSEATDVFAFAMVMYEVAAREPPFRHRGALSVALRQHVARGGRPEVPLGVPEAYAELMVACWAQEPAARPTFDEAVRTLVAMLGVL